MRLIQILLAGLTLLLTPLWAQDIQSPEAYFGHVMGADRQLIDWKQIVEYFLYLGERSNRVLVEELGKSTMGKPFLLVTITAEQDLPHLERYRELQRRLGQVDPPAGGPDEAAALIQEGKTVVLLTLNIHATEIAASQESVELAWELATRSNQRVQTILDSVILLMVPSLNPDGQQMIVDYYNQTKDTESEGASFPGLYHYYAGHDNNRDWFFFNLAESRLLARVLFYDWYPEIVYDQHQMGSNSARLFVPPYQDPVNPNIHPRLTAAVNMLGNYVLADLTDRGFTGIITGTLFNAFFEGTMSKTPLWHNRLGILTEAASVRYATPTYHPKTSLEGMYGALSDYQAQTNFPHPWPGGWWHLRDIIEYEKAATYAILDLAASYKTRYKTTYYELNREAIERGRTEAPYAWVIPPDLPVGPASQHDPNAAVELLRRLRYANVKIYRARQPVDTGEVTAPAGSFVIPLAQPNRPYIKDLMERQHYPDMRLYPGGPPLSPYDLTTWSLPPMMGVKAIPVTVPLTAELEEMSHPAWDLPAAPTNAQTYLLSRRWINSYRLVNALLKAGHKVGSLNKPTQVGEETFPAGSFVIPVTRRNRTILQEAHTSYEVRLTPVSSQPESTPLKAARIALYGPYLPAYDEGWTRYIFDNFGFDYTLLRNKDFASLGTLKRYDVIIVPSMRTSMIVDGKYSPTQKERIGDPPLPEEYRGGIGKEGKENLKRYLLEGGTVLLFGQSGDFAIDELGVPARNVLKDLKSDDFFAPGTIFQVNLDPSSPLTCGMPATMPIYFIRDPAYALVSGPQPHRETATYGPTNPLLSGWVLGDKHLHNKVALAELTAGKGKALLYGFRVQNRAQTWGTFRLLFNALYIE
ncbi:MAG: M14 metallopeptidase family protein [Candidatus Neomarinimicrobiota bacterium]